MNVMYRDGPCKRRRRLPGMKSILEFEADVPPPDGEIGSARRWTHPDAAWLATALLGDAGASAGAVPVAREGEVRHGRPRAVEAEHLLKGRDHVPADARSRWAAWQAIQDRWCRGTPVPGCGDMSQLEGLNGDEQRSSRSDSTPLSAACPDWKLTEKLLAEAPSARSGAGRSRGQVPIDGGVVAGIRAGARRPGWSSRKVAVAREPLVLGAVRTVRRVAGSAISAYAPSFWFDRIDCACSARALFRRVARRYACRAENLLRARRQVSGAGIIVAPRRPGAAGATLWRRAPSNVSAPQKTGRAEPGALG